MWCWTNRLPYAVVNIWCLKDFVVMILTFTGALDSQCIWFPIGVSLKPSLYLARHGTVAEILRYCCQTLSQAYSLDWKCIDSHFCVLGCKVEGHSILQLCACSRSLGTSFELLTAEIGPQAWLLRCSDLLIENALWGWKLGQNRGRVIGSSDFDPIESILLLWSITSV